MLCSGFENTTDSAMLSANLRLATFCLPTIFISGSVSASRNVLSVTPGAVKSK